MAIGKSHNYFLMIEIIRTAHSIIPATHLRKMGISVPPYVFILKGIHLRTFHVISKQATHYSRTTTKPGWNKSFAEKIVSSRNTTKTMLHIICQSSRVLRLSLPRKWNKLLFSWIILLKIYVINHFVIEKKEWRQLGFCWHHCLN